MRYRLAILLLCLVVAAGVWAQEQAREEPGYFPEGVFGESADVASWYAYALRVMGEPSLLEMTEGAPVEAYRLLRLRAGGAPMAVRLDVNADGGGAVTVKVGDGQGAELYSMKKVVEIDRRVVTREQVQALAALVDKDGFWWMESDEPAAKNAAAVGGASVWVIEAVRGDNYHVVARVSAESRTSPESKAVVEIGEMLVKMGNRD